MLLPLGNKLRDLKTVGTTLLKILPSLRDAQDPGYEEEVKLSLEIKFLKKHAVEIEIITSPSLSCGGTEHQFQMWRH